MMMGFVEDPFHRVRRVVNYLTRLIPDVLLIAMTIPDWNHDDIKAIWEALGIQIVSMK